MGLTRVPRVYAHPHLQVFLTGRSEADRDATAANLLAAGYGTQCDTLSAATTTTTITTTTITTTTTSSVSAGAAGTTGAAAAGAGGRGHRMLQWALPFSKAGGATEAGAEAGGGGRRPACYAALLMREDGDERLASVFKAEARGRLAAEGHVLVGNIGDQVGVGGLWWWGAGVRCLPYNVCSIRDRQLVKGHGEDAACSKQLGGCGWRAGSNVRGGCGREVRWVQGLVARWAVGCGQWRESDGGRGRSMWGREGWWLWPWEQRLC